MYRGLRNVNDIEIAMSRIGVDGIHELVFSNSLKSIIFKNKKYQKHIQEIWMNSLITALIASKVAKELKLNSSIIYTTALVHKLGSVLIFDIINDFNKDADFIDYLHDDFALRIGLPFNKRLTVNILEKWGFNKKQVNSVKNYDISPVVVAELEHKILYLSQITAGALDVIMLDYDEDSIFPYTFMLREASLEMDVNIFKEIVEDSLSFYNNFLRYLYS